MTSISIAAGGETTTLTTPEAMARTIYRERAHLLALLAAFFGPGVAHIGNADPQEPDWPVLTLELPTGQASWHIAPDDVELFGHVRATTLGDRPWDGHSTDAKYGRVAHLARALGAGHDAVVAVLSEQALDCGRCVTEDGVAVHPHPECPVRTPCQTCPRADNINGPCPCETED